MKLPDNVYIIVDFSIIKTTSIGYMVGIILDKDLKSSASYLSLYYDRKSEDMTVHVMDKYGRYITVDWQGWLQPKCGDVLTAGNIPGKFSTYWHHGAYDKQICEILKQHDVCVQTNEDSLTMPETI